MERDMLSKHAYQINLERGHNNLSYLGQEFDPQPGFLPKERSRWLRCSLLYGDCVKLSIKENHSRALVKCE